jgi:DNA-damage-inducible protein D
MNCKKFMYNIYMKKKTSKNQLAIFEGFGIRRVFDEKQETWYFSVVDVISALTESNKPRDYWYAMKIRVKSDDGVELSTLCRQLKLESSDGKKYDTDCANVESVFRIIQSVPSPKAEPFKRWLAKVGYERMQEMTDPEMGINRARENWAKHGRTKEWIQRRMMGQETRNKLTDYWSENQVKKGEEFAILTNIIHEEWSGLSVRNHKNLKNLKTQNLRDHMSEAELIFTALAEMSTRQIAEKVKAKGMRENILPAKRGGAIAKDARKALESKTGKSVITGKNFLKAKKSKKLKT